MFVVKLPSPDHDNYIGSWTQSQPEKIGDYVILLLYIKNNNRKMW